MTPREEAEPGGYPLAPEESVQRPQNLPGDVTLADTDAPRVTLARARLLAENQGEVRRGAAQVARARQRDKARRQGRSGGGNLSGPGEDPRDPVGLGRALTSLIRSRGWSDPVAVGSVLTRWDEIVGASVATHSTPESFENATVTVRCDSTAWATQLRLMQHDLLKRFDAAVGHGVVTSIRVIGPNAPSWRRGPRSAPGGRGPRDTYG
jgi:predicted nucleic acid-binding Zn ribbon protein